MTLRLSVQTLAGDVEGLSVDVRGPVVVGRDPSCHVVLPSTEVSRRHLTLEVGNGGVRLVDRSANGTFVGDNDEQHVHNAELVVPVGAMIRVGPYRLRVLGDAAVPGAGSKLTEPPPRLGPPHAPDPNARTFVPDAHGNGNGKGADLLAGSPAAQALDALLEGEAAVAGDVPLSGRYGNSGTAAVTVPSRRKIHRLLLDRLDLVSLDRNKMDARVMRPKVREALTRICREMTQELPQQVDVAALIEEMTDEALGLGPLEVLLADTTVSEVMVVDPRTIYIERNGKIEKTDLRFTDDDSVRSVIERIVTPLGRRIDESTPIVDARLKDGSRVNAVIPPLALRGPCITIRKFRKEPFGLRELVGFGTLTEQMARFLTRAVMTRQNIVISGGTGSGKTTLLNVLSSAIPHYERLVTVEDAAELRLTQPHVVSLEARPPNMEGQGAVTIRDLVRNALRMRPDRIIVGECRGGEALDMLQAMNTGHEGSMTTTHANSPAEALARVETLALMAGIDLPGKAVREQIAGSIEVIVQTTRYSDGSRRISAISEIVGLEDDGSIEHHEIFKFYRTGTGPRGEVYGEFRATGYLPTFIDRFITHGLVKGTDYL
jgi:pilus assembly protein CpaF